jgi:serine/threonine protein kinase/WD40 repeat protein
VDPLASDDPSQIGSFRLLGRLGEGGMGRVYLGVSPGGRKVAVKVVHPREADDPQFRRRFAREVDAARQVGGFHTAAVVDADPAADPPWMATAYITGLSLAAAIAEGGPLDEAGVRELGAALAEGLAAIHACGLIHRDLKPSNVILADDGPRIIDFGIAKGTDATAITGSSAVIGTLRYMSPEQMQGQELTPRSDVFALGTVLAYAATGHYPFEAPAIPAVLTRILHDPPSLDPLAGDLRDIIADCLAKQPSRRPSPAALLSRFRPPRSPGEPATVSAPVPAPRAAGAPAPAAPAPDVSQVTTVKRPSPAARKPTPARPGTMSGTPSTRGQPWTRWPRRRLALITAGTTAAIALAVLGALLAGNYPAGPLSTTLTATLTAPQMSGVFSSVNSVAFGPGGILATGDSNGNTYLWNTTTGKITATLTNPAPGSGNRVGSVAFGPGGILATGDSNANIYLWNTTTRKITATLTNPITDPRNYDTYPIANSVAFGPSGLLAIGTYDYGGDGNSEEGNTYLWNTTTRKITATLTNPHSRSVNSVAFGPDGVLATGDGNGSVYLWNTTTRKITATLTPPSNGGIDSVAFGPGGLLAIGDWHGRTQVWNTATRHVSVTLPAPSSGAQGVNSVAFGPDGILATGDSNGEGYGSTYLWNTTTGRAITTTLPVAEDHGISSVAFGPGGLLATSKNDVPSGNGINLIYLFKIT